MAAESMWDVQSGLFTRLTATSGVTSLLASGASSVLDHVPAGTSFPYVVIGEGRSQPYGVMGTGGSDISVVIHTYSQGSGMKQAKQIMAAIHTALDNASFSIPNQTLVSCRYTGGEAVLEADGITRRATQTFQIITQPA